MPRVKGFMGKSWDAFVPPPSLWDEVFRVLKPGGHALVFAGSRTQDLMGLSLRLSGFEIRDCIQWIYGSGFPKSLNIGKAVDKIQGNERTSFGRSPNSRENCDKSNTLYKSGTVGKTFQITKGESKWEGWGTALKPSFEPAILVRKPFRGSVAQNVLDHGVGGINIDGCKIHADDVPEGRSRNGGGLINGFSFQLPDSKSYMSAGRWPSNVLLSEDIKEEWTRFFYCPKASREEREMGLDGFEKKKAGAMRGEETRPNKPSNHPIRANIHPTVKPIDLMKYLCRLITPPGGTVLEPFMGSGSTGIGAIKEGFDFIGIEREEEYFEIAKARIEYWTSIDLTYEDNEEKVVGEQLSLFGN